MRVPTLHYCFSHVTFFALLLLIMQAVHVLSCSKPNSVPFFRSNQEPLEPLHQEYYRICPLPKCRTCATAEEILAPGIEFALEMGYGTAAVRLHNGSYQTVTRISGTPAYKSLLCRLASGPQSRIPDKNFPMRGYLAFLSQNIRRFLNKYFGRPATPEAAILVDMISMLKVETEAMLGDRKIVAVGVLSSPDVIKLTTEEINDVFGYLRIRNLMAEPNDLENLHAASAAYAGLGMGLCEKYTEVSTCELEEWDFPSQRLLHLDFSPDNRSGTIKIIQSARDGSVDEAFIDPTLGLRRLHELTQEYSLDLAEEENAYWTAVNNRIRTLVKSFRRVYLPQMTQIILTGTSASDPRFKAVVKDALRDLVRWSTLENINGYPEDGGKEINITPDLVFATAKGAAEFAKRRQEGPVRCEETEKCKRARKRLEQKLAKSRARAEL